MGLHESLLRRVLCLVQHLHMLDAAFERGLRLPRKSVRQCWNDPNECRCHGTAGASCSASVAGRRLGGLTKVVPAMAAMLVWAKRPVIARFIKATCCTLSHTSGTGCSQ